MFSVPSPQASRAGEEEGSAPGQGPEVLRCDENRVMPSFGRGL